MVDVRAVERAPTFIGRKAEQARLRELLHEDGPRLLYLHGIAGVGKSSLLQAFAGETRAAGATVIGLDCRSIEPTQRGFTHNLALALGNRARTPAALAGRMGSVGQLVVLILDTYEVFRFLDVWLRETFIPALPNNVRVILCGREPPVPAWMTSTRWGVEYASMTLDPLSGDEAHDLLRGLGVSRDRANRIEHLVHGNPLAIKLAAATIADRPDFDLDAQALPHVIAALAGIYLADVTDPLTRRVLQAGSVIRRGTRSLLQAMLPETAPEDAFERLRLLPFVTSGRDGLIIHDAVREALAAHLRAVDPTAFRELKQRAWRQLRTESHSAGIDELWRYTADILYLLENPAIREAFFPSGGPQFSVQRATAGDEDAIRAILCRRDTEESAEPTLRWFELHPETFFVVRDQDGLVAGIHCVFDPAKVDQRLLLDDPMTRAWHDHVCENPISSGETVLFLRCLLSQDYGEMPSPVQAASWLEIKRTYMELRPKLRRIYVGLRDEARAAFAPALTTLGFQPVTRLDMGEVYNLAVNDFGPGSVDGWLARLVAVEIGIEQFATLDSETQELVLGGRRVPLTRLEASVFQYLSERPNRVVSRATLIEDVWGYSYSGGSNVVDAVIRSLRKKLGDRASVVETVSGRGYRMRELLS